MRDYGERLRRGLEGYENILWEKALALPKHQPQLARWVKEFLLFAREHGGYTFEQTLDLSLAEVGRRVGTKPWQVQQAADALRIYRYQYRGARDGRRPRPASRGDPSAPSRQEHRKDLPALEAPLPDVSPRSRGGGGTDRSRHQGLPDASGGA